MLTQEFQAAIISLRNVAREYSSLSEEKKKAFRHQCYKEHGAFAKILLGDQVLARFHEDEERLISQAKA